MALMAAQDGASEEAEASGGGGGTQQEQTELAAAPAEPLPPRRDGAGPNAATGAGSAAASPAEAAQAAQQEQPQPPKQEQQQPAQQELPQPPEQQPAQQQQGGGGAASGSDCLGVWRLSDDAWQARFTLRLDADGAPSAHGVDREECLVTAAELGELRALQQGGLAGAAVQAGRAAAGPARRRRHHEGCLLRQAAMRRPALAPSPCAPLPCRPASPRRAEAALARDAACLWEHQALGGNPPWFNFALGQGRLLCDVALWRVLGELPTLSALRAYLQALQARCRGGSGPAFPLAAGLCGRGREAAGAR